MTLRHLRRLVPLTDFAWFVLGAAIGFAGLAYIFSTLFPGGKP